MGNNIHEEEIIESHDIEKNPSLNKERYVQNEIEYTDSYEIKEEEEKSEQSSKDESSIKKLLTKWGKYLNVETRGIEKVPIEERTDTSLLIPFTIFFSPQMAVSALSTGSLAPIMGLDFRSAVLCSIFCNIIGAMVVGVVCLFGLKTGLRQQIASRYLTGNIMGRIFAFFNVISCIGWNAINLMPAAGLLYSVNHNFKPWLACLILVLIICFVSCVGYKFVHYYERYAWLPTFIVYIVIIVRFTQSRAFEWGDMNETTARGVLGYIVIATSFTMGWAPSASDYLVYFKPNVSGFKVATAMTLGLSIPAIISCILGAAITSCIYTPGRFQDAYNENSFSGLLYEIIVGESNNKGYKFLVVVLALSAVQNNLSGGYSLSLATQCISERIFQRIPRVLLCIIGNLISLAFAIPAYYVFEAAMANFLSIIGYNVSIYVGIISAEHFIFRKGNFANYNTDNFNNKLNYGISFAGIFAFCCGIGSTVVFMDQTWYSGVFAQHVGDISLEMNIVISFVAYCLTRPIELKYIGR
ncbi:uncharacterized protein KGF55_000777 [Candida pseudojiufengensis]|uniref:uncharacterized protein n=1 Tax=Candida pseudojiufengensis TaxID=497109 RepID=UPI0022250851|nr:uncharacterized protein KGF55_000777 [Candida pseudojiufengensis]KAI5966468.1 hypothetical protein KGF55_000777 [Candida pseudojiufengensis]